MASYGLVPFFGLVFLSFQCEGKINLPPGGNSLVVLPGSTVSINWTFTDDPTKSTLEWYFEPGDGSSRQHLATKYPVGEAQLQSSSLTRVTVEDPATLVLTNVDQNYNGTYKLVLKLSGVVNIERSDFAVFIAEKPTVTVCSSPLIINEGEDGSCACRGDNGNPPASVVWFDKNNKQIDEKKIGENTLNLTNVDGTDSGSYKCVAESFSDDSYKDEKTVQVDVRLNFRPRKINITSSQRKAEIGEAINITCESEGQPEPSFIITHNESEIIAEKTYNIPQVRWRDSGLYQCIAKNQLGSNSKCYCLTVLGEATSSKKEDRDTGDTVVAWHIVVSLISGVVIGCLLSYIVSCSRRKFISKYPKQPNPEVDKTYQELDLTKNNKEENYQSLTVNQPAKNDNRNENDSNYTELSQTREPEKTYKSLT